MSDKKGDRKVTILPSAEARPAPPKQDVPAEPVNPGPALTRRRSNSFGMAYQQIEKLPHTVIVPMEEIKAEVRSQPIPTYDSQGNILKGPTTASGLAEWESMQYNVRQHSLIFRNNINTPSEFRKMGKLPFVKKEHCSREIGDRFQRRSSVSQSTGSPYWSGGLFYFRFQIRDG